MGAGRETSMTPDHITLAKKSDPVFRVWGGRRWKPLGTEGGGPIIDSCT